VAKSILGLEFTDHCVKIVSLNKKQNSYYVEFAVEGLLDDGTVVGKSIVDIEAVVETLKKLIQHYQIKHKKVAIAVHSDSVISKVISLDSSFLERDIEQQLEFDAEKYIPYSLDDVRLDFQCLGPSEKEGKQDVLIVATHKEPVDIYTEVIEAAGLTPEIVDVYHYVLLRICESVKFIPDYEHPEKYCFALIDIGYYGSQMTIISDGQVLFGESFKFQEKIVDNRGIENVISWYKRHLQIFSANNKNQVIDCLVLYGDNAQISGVTKLFELITNKPTFIADPFKEMHILKAKGVDEKTYKYMIPMGLALRKVML
jgi:type IV pilus assembly protein PilM